MHKEQAENLENSLFNYFIGVVSQNFSFNYSYDDGVEKFFFDNVVVCLKVSRKGNSDYFVVLHFEPKNIKFPTISYGYHSIEAFNYDVFVDDLNFFNLPWVSCIGLLGDLAN